MKSRHRRLGPVLPVVAGIITLCTCLPTTQALASDFTVFNGGMTALDVSNNGVVVGIDNWNAWSWSSATGNVTLPPSTAGYYGRANGVSADGSVIVGTSFVPGSGGQQIANQAWRWTASTGTVSLGGLPTGQNEDWAYGVSSNGTVIVGAAMFCSGTSCGGPTAYNWTSTSGMQPLLVGGVANAVSGDGLVAVGMSDVGANPSLVRWTGELDGFYNPTFSNSTFDNLGNFYSSGRTISSGVSADGSVIVGYGWEYSGGTGNPQAWRWTQGAGFVGLGFLDNNYAYSEATGVSDDGSVIVGYSGLNAFVWTEANGMRSLYDILIAKGVTGIDSWDSLAEIYAISPDGKWVVGRFHNCITADFGCGDVSFLANIASTTVVPVPAAAWLFGSGLVGLIGFARRKARAV